jgi:hypothetical protein
VPSDLDENGMVEIELDLDDETIALLDAECARSGRTRDEVINAALRQAMERELKGGA